MPSPACYFKLNFIAVDLDLRCDSRGGEDKETEEDVSESSTPILLPQYHQLHWSHSKPCHNTIVRETELSAIASRPSNPDAALWNLPIFYVCK